MEENKTNGYLSELYKAYDYSTTEFDKSLTYISSGLLAVSFAFIDKLVPLDESICKNYLISGWYLLLTAILISVLAHFLNIVALKYVIKNYQEIDNSVQKRSRTWGEISIQFLNISTLVLILFGGLFIIRFIKINI